MPFLFDPSANAANISRHGVSLAWATEVHLCLLRHDERFSEARFRGWGLLHDLPHSLAFSINGQTARSVSLRRAHAVEVDALPKAMRRKLGEQPALDPEANLTDPANPKWTYTDFETAAPPDLFPEFTSLASARARGETKRGALGSTKRPVSLRIDIDVLAAFRGTGPGWQSRMNDALRNMMPNAA